MITDCELLRHYAEQSDETAFTEVVRHNVDLVYSAALRQVGGHAHLAQDVTQIVFTSLARQARGLSRRASITGWLYTTTKFTACKLMRGEHRRFAREQEAFTMQDTTHAPEPDWDLLRPALDEAVCQLNATDREAVLLRFFQNKSHREVGDVLGLNEDTARKRIERALEKLRAYFGHRGVTVSTTLLATAISANSVQAAPAGLATSIAGTSITGASGAAAGSIFARILIMSSKTKLLLTLAVVVAIMAIFTINWPFNTRKSKAADVVTVASSATQKTAASAISPIVVATPTKSTVNPPPRASEKNAVNSGNATTRPSAPARVAGEPANGSAAVMVALETAKADPLTYTPGSGKMISPPELLNDLSLLKIVPLVAFYNVSAIDIANSGGLETAQEDGFIYTVYPPAGTGVDTAFMSSVVHVDANGAANGAVLDSIAYDREISPVLDQLQNLVQVQTGSYEMRRLLVHRRGTNSVAMVWAIWLKSKSGGADLIYPYRSNPALQVSNQLYTIDDFLNIIRQATQQ